MPKVFAPPPKPTALHVQKLKKTKRSNVVGKKAGAGVGGPTTKKPKKPKWDVRKGLFCLVPLSLVTLSFFSLPVMT